MTTDAVIYTRISKDSEGAGLGVARQQRECRELAERRGWLVSQVCSDNDVSAYSGKPRPGYAALMEAINAGQVVHVIAWHQDRLHRNVRELEDFIDLIEAKGVSVDTVAGGTHDFTTPNGRMYARMSGVVARNASEQASERIKSKFREKAAAGEYSGGVRPFGYESDGVTVRPEEAQVVVQATREVLAGGSLRDIAKRLNDAAVTSSLGKPWSPNQVKAMVVRARNVGLRVHRGEVVGAAKWPAIVDEADWRSAVAILKDPSRRTTTTNVRKYLLSGVLTCFHCGGAVSAKSVQPKRKNGTAQPKRLVYECRYGHCCSRALHHVDEMVSELVIERLSRSGARDLFATDPDDDMVNIRDEADSLAARMDDAAQAFAAGAITLAQLTTITETCRTRLDAINRKLAQASGDLVLAELVGASDVRAVWNEFSLARKRAVIEALFAVSIRKTDRRGPGFDPESVVVTWR